MTLELRSQGLVAARTEALDSIRRVAGWVTAMACLAGCLSGCAAQNEPAKTLPPPVAGSVFVAKPLAEGVYIEMTGMIVEMDCSDITMDVDGNRMMFERKVVRRVAVNVKDRESEIGKKAASCWSQEDSALMPIVKALEGIEVIGSLLKGVEGLNSPRVQTTLGLVILFGGLVLVAYRLYDFFYGSATERNLKLEKLNLEVKRLRHELDGVGKPVGLQPPAVSAPDSSAIQERLRARLELPKLHIGDFIKYKILRILSDQQKMARHDRWAKRWQAWRGNSQGGAFRYMLLMAVYAIGVIAAALLALAFALGVLMSLSDSTLGVSFGVICVVLGLLCLSVLLRLVAQRRIIRDSYRESVKQAVG
jgi:hypothetical protein